VPGVHPEPTFEELPVPAAIRRSGGWEPATAVGCTLLSTVSAANGSEAVQDRIRGPIA
jgi:hypothetical protein